MLNIVEVLEMNITEQIKELLEKNGFEVYEYYINGETTLNGYNKKNVELVSFSYQDMPDIEIVESFKETIKDMGG